MDYVLNDLHGMAKEILANQRVILTYIKGNANGNMKYESSSSVNMHDNNQINGGRSFSNNRNPFSTLNKENFHTAPIQNGTKEITPTQVKRNNELLNFIGPAIVTSTPKYPLNRYNPMNSSRIQNPKQSLGNGAHAQNNMNLFSSNGKADAQKNFPKRQDLNVTLPKKMKLAPDVNSTPSQRRGPGRPFGSTKQSLIPQVNKLTVMVPPNKAINEARKIPAKENNNQTLGDHLGMKAPKVCQLCDNTIDTRSISKVIKHTWEHILKRGGNMKDLHSYYCEVPDCKFASNYRDTANFHSEEGHKVVDNCEATAQLFKSALNQAFDLDESLEKKINKMRHHRDRDDE